MLPKHILVPTDLGEGAEQALDYACELAQALGARVHLLNVVNIPAIGVPELGIAMTSSFTDQLVIDNQAAICRLAQTKGTVQIGHALVKVGDTREVINRTAKELGIDLIVMSTHGRRGIARAFLGSVAEIVVRSAPCAVLTVRLRDIHDSDRHAA